MNSDILEQGGGGPGNKQSKLKKWLLRIGAVIILALLAVFIYYHFFYNPAPIAIVAGDKFPGVRDAEELQEAVQAEVDASYFDFEINARPVFPNGSTNKGNLYIVNPSNNAHLSVVQIVHDETGEVIYDSGGLLPGYEITGDELLVDLEQGEHNATAHFYVYDPDTELAVGEVTASLIITVEG